MRSFFQRGVRATSRNSRFVKQAGLGLSTLGLGMTALAYEHFSPTWCEEKQDIKTNPTPLAGSFARDPIELIFTKDMSCERRHRMERMVRGAQAAIANALEEIEGPDGAKCVFREYHRPSTGNLHGGGIECVIQGGKVFEKGGVGISVSHGNLSAGAFKSMSSRNPKLAAMFPNGSTDEDPARYFAGSISLVIHGRNPFVPTVHMNYRYFEVTGDGPEIVAWHGGGQICRHI